MRPALPRFLSNPPGDTQPQQNQGNAEDVVGGQIGQSDRPFGVLQHLVRFEGKGRKRREGSHEPGQNVHAEAGIEQVLPFAQTPDEAEQQTAAQVHRQRSPGETFSQDALGQAGKQVPTDRSHSAREGYPRQFHSTSPTVCGAVLAFRQSDKKRLFPDAGRKL